MADLISTYVPDSEFWMMVGISPCPRLGARHGLKTHSLTLGSHMASTWGCTWHAKNNYVRPLSISSAPTTQYTSSGGFSISVVPSPSSTYFRLQRASECDNIVLDLN